MSEWDLGFWIKVGLIFWICFLGLSAYLEDKGWW